MRIVEVFTMPLTALQRGQKAPSKFRWQCGQVIAILSRRELRQLLFARSAVLSHIIEDNLNESQRRLGQRFVAPVNQAQASNHRLGREGDGFELAGGDLLLAVRDRQEGNAQTSHDK